MQCDPIRTAKLVVSTDRVSGGLFLFGVGGGRNAEEIEDHGAAFKTHFKLMRERIEAMKAIWTEAKPEYRQFFADDDSSEPAFAPPIVLDLAIALSPGCREPEIEFLDVLIGA